MPLDREPYPPNTLFHHLQARAQAQKEAALRIMYEEGGIERRAEALLKGGFTTVIPSEHLQDEEVLVSHKVYEEFKKRVS